MKLLIALLTLFTAVATQAANPAFQDFNTNQFGTTGNKVFFKATGNGAVVTNFNVVDGTLWVLSPAEFRVSGTGTEGEGRFLVSDLNGVLGYRTNWVLTSITNGLLSGDLSLNGRTNRLSISAGGQLLLDGSPITGGDTVWTNSLGTVMPMDGQTTNRLQFVSGAADDGTNVAFFVDTTSTWTAGKLFELRNTGTNRVTVGHSGILFLGHDAPGYITNASIGDEADYSLISIRLATNNDARYNKFFFGAAADAEGNQYGAVWGDVATNLGSIMTEAITPSGGHRFQAGFGGAESFITLSGENTNLFTVHDSGQLSIAGRTNLIGDNNSTITYNGVPISGDTTATNIVTLTQTGTNAAQLDFALVARGGVFKLSLTNNAYFGAPANVNNTDFKKAWLAVKQPSTGTCLVTFTNGFFAQPGGNALVNDTNAGAIVWYEMLSNPFSNGIVDVWMSQKSQLVP